MQKYFCGTIFLFLNHRMSSIPLENEIRMDFSFTSLYNGMRQ